MKLSKHCETRRQQRAISLHAIDFLEYFGIETLQKGGTYHITLPVRRLRAIKRAVKDLHRNLDRLEGTYLIETEDGLVITAGHKY